MYRQIRFRLVKSKRNLFVDIFYTVLQFGFYFSFSGTSFQLFVNAGFLLAYSFGVVLRWYYLAFLCDVIPVLFAIAMYFNKESPNYLLMKGQEEEAIATLKYFRGEPLLRTHNYILFYLFLSFLMIYINPQICILF